MNTCVLAISFGRYLDLVDDELVTLGLCGMLHDIGKLAISKDIINKPTGLDAEEMTIMQSHTTLGKNILSSHSKKGGEIAEILNKSTGLDFEVLDIMRSQNTLDESLFTSSSRGMASIIAEVAYCHHERLDGLGYPRGLSGKQISPYAKMIAIIDAYDSLTSDKPYQKAETHFEAINVLLTGVNTQFDETLVNCFIQSLGAYPAGSAIEMNSGELAIVIEVNQHQKLRPKIILLSDQEKQPLPEKIIDLSQTFHDAWGKPYAIKTIIRPDAYNLDVNKYYDYGVIQKSLAAAA